MSKARSDLSRDRQPALWVGFGALVYGMVTLAQEYLAFAPIYSHLNQILAAGLWVISASIMTLFFYIACQPNRLVKGARMVNVESAMGYGSTAIATQPSWADALVGADLRMARIGGTAPAFAARGAV